MGALRLMGEMGSKKRIKTNKTIRIKTIKTFKTIRTFVRDHLNALIGPKVLKVLRIYQALARTNLTKGS